MATGVRIQQTARAGEHYVVAEFNRRMAYAVTFADVVQFALYY